MKKQTKYSLLTLLFYFLLSLFAIRNLLDPNKGLGHNWDSPFSTLTTNYVYELKSLPYTWNDKHSLGLPIIVTMSTKIFWLFNSLIGILLDGHLVTQFMIVLLSTLSAWLIFLYILKIQKKSPPNSNWIGAFSAGLFMLFSPVAFGHIIGGAFNQYFTMIFVSLQLLILETRKTYSNTSVTALMFSLPFIVISIALHNLIFGVFFTVTYVFVLYKLSFTKKLVLATQTLTVSLLFNFYWFLPLIYGLLHSNVSKRLSENLSFDNLVHNVPALPDGFFANGYIRPFYNYMVLGNQNNFFKASGLLLVSVIFFSIAQLLRHQKKTCPISIYWLGSFAFFLCFATGFNSPLRPIVECLYRYFPLMAIFRSPQWWMMPLSISFSVLLGLGIGRLRKLALPCLLLLTYVLHPFYASGDLGIEKLYQRQLQTDNWYKADHLDNYLVPQDYQDAISIIERDPEDAKVILLPLSLSPYFNETSYQRQGSGVDPILAYLSPKPVIFSDIYTEYDGKHTVGSLEKSIYYHNSLNFLSLSGIFNAKYILYKKDYSPVFSNYRNYWNNSRIEKLLKDNIDSLGQILIDGESTLLIELLPKYRWPHVYTDSSPIYIEGSSETLNTVSDFVKPHLPKALYFSSSQSSYPITSIDEINKYGLILGGNVINHTAETSPANLPSDFDIFFRDNPRHPWAKSKDSIKPNLYNPKTNTINDYHYDTEYELSFEYQTTNPRANLTVTDNLDSELINVILPLSPKYKKHVISFRSSPSPDSPTISINGAIAKNLTIIEKPVFEVTLIKLYDNPLLIPPSITFQKITPTEYDITIGHTNKPFVLVFSEMFHPGWQLLQNGEPVFQDTHRMVNGYANSWFVDPQKLSDSSTHLKITYFPQKLFQIGLGVSLLSFLTIPIYILLSRHKE